MQKLRLKRCSGIDSRNNARTWMVKTTNSIIANWKKRRGEIKIHCEGFRKAMEMNRRDMNNQYLYLA